MNNENIVIHVGLRKTATTWLQEELFSKLNSINYLGKTNKNYPKWLIEWHYLDDYAFETKIEYIKKEFFKLIDNSKVNILSSEAFTNTGVIYSQANRIKKIVSNARIIITLRDPIEILKSHYKLDVQDGVHFWDLEYYLDWKRTPFDLFKRKPYYLPDLFFDENIEYYHRLFGKENVLILKYEDMRDNPQKFFMDLSKFIGVDIDYKKLNLSKKKNKSLDQNLAEKKYENFINFVKNNSNSCDDIYINKNCFNDSIITKDLEEKLKKYFKGKCFGYY